MQVAGQVKTASRLDSVARIVHLNPAEDGAGRELDMGPHVTQPSHNSKCRRNIVQQYMQLQRALMDEDPASSSYQGTIHAFRQLGYMLVTSGMGSDLDRLLRLRVLMGGRESPVPRGERSPVGNLRLVG